MLHTVARLSEEFIIFDLRIMRFARETYAIFSSDMYVLLIFFNILFPSFTRQLSFYFIPLLNRRFRHKVTAALRDRSRPGSQTVINYHCLPVVFLKILTRRNETFHPSTSFSLLHPPPFSSLPSSLFLLRSRCEHDDFILDSSNGC